MLKTIWKLIRTAVIVIGVLLTFFAVLEILRAFQILHEMHPVAGYVFLVVVLGLLLWCVIYFWANMAVFPKALRPPRIDDVQAATDRQLKKYIQYLRRFLQRLISNPNLRLAKATSGCSIPISAMTTARRLPMHSHSLKANLQPTALIHLT